MIRIAVLISGLLLAAGWALFSIKLGEVSSVLVIHFDSYRGIDFFGTRNDLLGILIVGSIIGLVNTGLTRVFYTRERFLSYILSFGTVVSSLLILVAAGVIISIN